jgi:membrane-bound serine protease (ClpP class)
MSPTEYAGIGLLLLSAVLFLLEVKTAGFGVLGAGGVVALVVGLWLLVASSPFALPIVLAAGIPVAMLVAFLAVLAHRARRNKIVTGGAGMIGLEGRCETDLLPEGRVIVRGELWDAWSPIRLERGQPVRVTGVRGMRLEVSADSHTQNIQPPRSIVGVDKDD